MEIRRLDDKEVKERLARDPQQAFVLGAFLDSELIGTAGMFRERFGKAQTQQGTRNKEQGTGK